MTPFHPSRTLALALLLGAAPLAGGHPCAEQQKLIASDGMDRDEFGISVGISGDTLVVGASFHYSAGLQWSGAAYVYTRSGGIWTESQRLVASDAEARDEFGRAVATSGDTIVVGAIRDDDGGMDAGAAYVYVRSGAAWTQQQKLLASDAASRDEFGNAVAIAGDTIVVGAKGGGPNAIGAAYVFTRSAGAWTEAQKLVGTNRPLDLFGESVSISGDTILIGAAWEPLPGGNQEGAAHVFVRSAGFWTEQQRLVASDAAVQDRFGSAVSVDGDTAVVGAERDDSAFTDSGSAYIYGRSGGVWTEQQKIVPSGLVDSGYFGHAASISGDMILIGAFHDPSAAQLAGATYIFARSAGGWAEQRKFVGSDTVGNDQFGTSVSISGELLVVGGRLNDNLNGRDAGAAYVFGCSANAPATCNAGEDVAQPCDGVQLVGSVDNPGGAPLAFRWTSSCAGASFSPSDDVLDPIVSFGSACGVSCDLTLSVDAGGVLCSDVVHVEIDDTTPPNIQADARDKLCVWSPRHWWACYERADFHPAVTDDCGAPTWRFLDCVSDQPVDDVGDGHTDPDCLVSADGDRVCVRAERQGGEPAGRTYTVSIEAVDACGNASEAAIGTITVPHDRRNHPDCRVTPRGGRRLPSR